MRMPQLVVTAVLVEGCSPAASTIWLTARGVVTLQPTDAPELLRPPRGRPAERTLPDRHHPLADGTDIEMGDWLDDHSRYCLASTAAPVFIAPPSTGTS